MTTDVRQLPISTDRGAGVSTHNTRDHEAQAVEPPTSKRALVAGSIGSLVEWYDWNVYGAMAPIFGVLIFPSSSPAVSLLLTFGVFALGFAARPLGAILLSPIGDKYGRKRLFSLTVMLMGVGCLILAVTPTYASIGIFAPILFVVARILQGMSAGGEWQSASPYIVEHGPQNRRGLMSSLLFVTVGLGILLGTGTSAIITSVVPDDALNSWGWRVPFLIGALLSLVSLYVRTRAPETPQFVKAAGSERTVARPIKEVFRHHKLAMTRMLAISTYHAPFYLWAAFLPTFTHVATGLPVSSLLLGSSIALVVYCVSLPFVGMLSDKIGRKPLLLAMPALFIMLGYPLFRLLSTPSVVAYTVAAIAGYLILTATTSIGSATFCELLPTEVRSTGMGLPYNIASAIFGGGTPIIASALVGSGNGMYIYLYLVGISIPVIIILSFMPEVAWRTLDWTRLGKSDVRGQPAEAT